MENYDRVIELQEIAADSAGRADEQFTKYADTLQFKINQLKNSWEQLRTEFLNSDFFKGGVEVATDFVNKIKGLDATDIASIAIVGMTLGKSLIKNFISSIQNSTNDVRNAMDSVLQKGFSTIGKNLKLRFGIETEDLETKLSITKGKILELAGSMEIATTSMTEDSFKIIEQYQKIGLEIDKLSAKQEKASENEKANIKEEILELQRKQAALRINFANATGTDMSKTGELFYELNNKEYNLAEDAARQRRNSAISSTLSNATQAAITTGIITAISSKNVGTTIKAAISSAAISSVPSITSAIAKAASSHPVQAAWIVGITAAVTVAGALIYKYVKSQQTELEKLQNQIDGAKNQLKDLESTEGSAKSTAKESQQQLDNIQKIRDTYDELYGKTVLTTEEEEKKAELIQQIREEYPQLIKHYNSETGELQIQNDLWDSIINKQKEVAAIDQHYANIANYVKLTKEDTIDSLKAQQRVVELNNATITQDVRNNVKRLSDQGLSAEEIVIKLKTDNNFNDEILKSVGMGSEEGLINAIQNNNREYLRNYEQVLSTEKQQQEDYINERKNVLAEEQLLIDDLAKQTGVSTNVAGFAEKFMTKGIDETLAEDLNLELEKGGMSETAKTIADTTLSLIAPIRHAQQIGTALGIINDTDERFSVSQALIDGFSEYFGIGKDAASDTLEEFKDLAPELQEALRSVYGSDAVEKWNETFRYNIELLDKEAVAKAKLYNQYLEESKKAVEKINKAGLGEDIDNFYAKLPEYNVNQIEKASEDFISAIQNRLGDNKLTDTELDIFKQEIEKQKEALITSINYIEDIVGKGILGDLNEADPEQIEAFKTYIKSLIDNGIDESTVKSFTQSFVSAFKNNKVAQEDWLPILNQLDFSSVDKSGFETFKENGIAAIQEITGKGEEEATKLFNEIAAKAKALGVLDVTITTSGAAEEYVATLKEIQQNAYAQRDTIISALNEQAENGVISLQTYFKLLESIAALGGNPDDYLNIDNGKISISNKAGLSSLYLSKTNIQNQIAESMMDTQAKLSEYERKLEGNLTDSERQQLEQLRDSAKETMDTWQYYYDNAGQLRDAFFEDYKSQLQERKEDTTKTLDDMKNAELKAIKEVEKAREDAIEKEKALYEALYGSKYYKAPVDDMYNYDVNSNRAKQIADDAKSALEDLQASDNAREQLQKYLKGVHEEAKIDEAEIRVLEQAISNGKNSLNTTLPQRLSEIGAKYGANLQINPSELYSEQNGRYNLNLRKIDALALPKEVKDALVNEITSWNENADKIEEIQKKKLERQKEFNEMYKKSLQDMVNLQDEMANALKEKYQKEIDDVTDKYSAMKEADDSYLDALEKAIEKERKLRDTQNKWDDLAQKEKKLSLLQRDTSGSNQIERQKLANEIQKDRTSLLDESVDNVVDELKELYETQQEEREAELEVLNALIDEAAIMKEVVEALMNITSSDELVAWFEQMTDTTAMSNEQIQLLRQNWADLFQSKETYLELSKVKFDEAIEASEKEIKETVDNTSETLTTKADSTLNEVADSADAAIGKAEEAWKDALDNIKEKEDALKTAIENTAAAQEKHNQAVKDFNDLIAVQGQQIINDTAQIGLAAAQLLGIINNPTVSNNPAINPSTGKSYGEENAYNADKNAKAEKITGSLAGGLSAGLSNISKTDPVFLKLLGGTTNEKQAFENLRLSIESSPNKYQIFDVSNFISEDKKDLSNLLSKHGFHGFIYDDEAYVAKDQNQIPIWYTNKANLAEAVGKNVYRFASGGLINYTGPAWVDGSPTNPEAFLSSEDTRRIGEAARILADLPILNTKWSSDNITTTNVGDTNVEINITVEGDIKDESTVDYLMEQVERKIVSTANYTGANVILHR